MSMFSPMKKSSRALVIQHSDQAPGGNFCKALTRLGCQLEILRPFNGDLLPDSPDGFDALVVLGGPQHSTDDHIAAHFLPLLELIRRFDVDYKPVAGICLGCQLLARAHGQTPGPLGFLELGFVQHSLTEAARLDPIFRNVFNLPPLMEFHEDTFALPDGATLLIKGENCRNQCFKIGNVSYGFQFHLEVDARTVTGWLDTFEKGQLAQYEGHRDGFSLASFEAVRTDLKAYIRRSEEFCTNIAGSWLSLVPGGRKG